MGSGQNNTSYDQLVAFLRVLADTARQCNGTSDPIEVRDLVELLQSKRVTIFDISNDTLTGVTYKLLSLTTPIAGDTKDYYRQLIKCLANLVRSAPGKTLTASQVQNAIEELSMRGTQFISGAGLHIIIPQGVTRLAADVFYGSNASNVFKITVPEGVTSIGNNAFQYATTLTYIDLPSTLRTIGSQAFYQCSHLDHVDIPEGVEILNESLFFYCPRLKHVTIPDSVAHISGRVFYNCSALEGNEYDNGEYLGNDNHPYLVLFRAKSDAESCVVSDQCKIIDENVFYLHSSLRSITIPENSVREIGTEAFFGCSALSSITIPEGVVSIGKGAFRGCSSLISVNLPDSLSAIGDEAFYYCESLTSIDLPDNITHLGEDFFSHCTKLTSINFPKNLESLGRYAFRDCRFYSFDIPEGVSSIAAGCFYHCTNLESINIPSSVTSIGYGAFDECDNLSRINFLGTTEECSNLDWTDILYGTSGIDIIYCADGEYEVPHGGGSGSGSGSGSGD